MVQEEDMKKEDADKTLGGSSIRRWWRTLEEAEEDKDRKKENADKNLGGGSSIRHGVVVTSQHLLTLGCLQSVQAGPAKRLSGQRWI